MNYDTTNINNGHEKSEWTVGVTYSTSNLNLIVDTASIRVVIRLGLRPSTETRKIDRSPVLVDLHVRWPLRFWLFKGR